MLEIWRYKVSARQRQYEFPAKKQEISTCTVHCIPLTIPKFNASHLIDGEMTASVRMHNVIITKGSGSESESESEYFNNLRRKLFSLPLQVYKQ